MSCRSKNYLYGLFLLSFVLNAGVWYSARSVKAQWLNVPPVPSETGARMMALGDGQFAYRYAGITLQNLGNVGGRDVPFADYDYDRLGQWFSLTDKLDPKSDLIPL